MTSRLLNNEVEQLMQWFCLRISTRYVRDTHNLSIYYRGSSYKLSVM